ncbi:DUF1566 domain-containing protein [Burkholderia cepacia]|uniref:DUF1566 domain-containing protein n=1 Tax=Burkholderia cepacia TaxID=292 RepID=UPI000F591F65|nr:DUF1566 domain-containing protein [Burkholderia cepacia]RQT74787.1 DUF1566 domain-containing protein [Burkholderia cepacia]
MQIQLPPLAEGEIYLGGFVNASGDVEHVILLPGDIRATWHKAKEWAESLGGDLLNRYEQALAFAKHPDLFEKTAYWSNAEDAEYPGWAWYQSFYGGNQIITHQHHELRARAVRRLSI